MLEGLDKRLLCPSSRAPKIPFQEGGRPGNIAWQNPNLAGWPGDLDRCVVSVPCRKGNLEVGPTGIDRMLGENYGSGIEDVGEEILIGR